MATEKKYLDLEGLKTYNEQVKSLIDTKETSGTAATKVKELADGQVKANTNAIATLQEQVLYQKLLVMQRQIRKIK